MDHTLGWTQTTGYLFLLYTETEALYTETKASLACNHLMLLLLVIVLDRGSFLETPPNGLIYTNVQYITVIMNEYRYEWYSTNNSVVIY